MARNCRPPEVGTPGSEPGNHRLPLQGTAVSGSQPGNHGNHRLPLQATAGSQRLELLAPKLGTMGYHRKCRLLKVGTEISQPGNQRLPLRFPKVGTHGCQRGNHRLPLQGTAGSQRLELIVHSVRTNLRLPTWAPEFTIAKKGQFPEVRTYVYESKRLSL